MLNYANAFSLSTDDNKCEFVLRFNQRAPIVDNAGNVTGIQMEEISTIVLNKEGFKALQMLLTSISDE